MLTDTLRTIVNKSYFDSIDTIFMGNIKSYQ